MKIRTFQPGDEAAQAAVYNLAAHHLPGFKFATEDDVRRRTRGRGFDPATRFYAEEGGKVVGYCTLEPGQGRVGYPWCRTGFEAARPVLLDAALRAGRDRGLTRVFAAYRRDWEPVLAFLSENGFARVRDMINYTADPVELPTLVNRSKPPIDRLTREDLPALAAMGQGVLRLPADQLEAYFFTNPYFPAEAFVVLRGPDGKTPVAVAVGLERPNYADVRKIDPLAPCYRLAAFGTEGRSTKRVNGLFSLLVADPVRSLTAGLALLTEVCQEMTEGSVEALAAQCPSDAPHLLAFYSRYFREQGRFPEYEKAL